MDDKIVTFIIYILFISTNRHVFFKCIYTGLFISNIYKLFTNKFKIKITSFFFYILTYVISYFLIMDPNPFYYLITFYLPLPNFFRAIFIIIFITYFFNNHILESKKADNKTDNKEENNTNKKENEKNNNNKDDDMIKNEIYRNYFLSKELKYLWTHKMKLFILFLSLILLRIIIYFYNIKYWIYFANKEKLLSFNDNKNIKIINRSETIYYISSIVFNMEPTIKDWISEMKKLINYLGKKNVIISIYENGDSTDNTRKYLLEFESYLIENEIINVVNTQKLVQKEGVDRIVFLSRLRNKSLDFLYYIMDLDFSNTKIIFFNDIIFRYEDIIKLITTNNGNYDTVCAMDYYESFYDTWASIGLDGKQFRRYFPYMYNKEQQDAYINGEIIRTFSCWNGVTVINAKPFEIRDNLFFRFGKKIRQSECTLLHADMYFMGYRKVFVNTQIAVAYTYEYYYKNHYIYPWTKNLITYFYYYFKYGFIKRNYNLTNLVDNDISMDNDLDEVVLEYMGK